MPHTLRDSIPDVPTLDATLSALQGGVTALPPDVALRLIDGWQQQIRASGRADLSPIADGLGELKGLLTSGRLDGQSIGHLLIRLGEQTGLAAGADGANPQIRRLGQILSRAGASLTGGSHTSMSMNRYSSPETQAAQTGHGEDVPTSHLGGLG